jgi:hypothetical protein
MARTDITPITIDRVGTGILTETTGDTVNGHSFTNDTDTRTFVYVRNNDGAGSHVITFLVYQTVDGQAVASKALTIPLSATWLTGPWPTAYTQVDGKVYFDVNSTQLRVAVFKLAAQ